MNLYRGGDVLSPPARYAQTACASAGGTTTADMKMLALGTYTPLHHAIFDIEKGAGCAGIYSFGSQIPQICEGNKPSVPCIGCKYYY